MAFLFGKVETDGLYDPKLYGAEGIEIFNKFYIVMRGDFEDLDFRRQHLGTRFHVSFEIMDPSKVFLHDRETYRFVAEAKLKPKFNGLLLAECQEPVTGG